MKEKGGSFLRSILVYIVIGLAGVGLLTGNRFLNENNNSQRAADISLNTYVENGQELPVKEYVSLDVRWVLGPIGTYTTTSTINFIPTTSGVEYWYFVMLEDGTFMTLSSSNNADRTVLDRMAQWLAQADGFPMDGETFRVQGTLRNLTNKDMKKIYEDFLTSSGVSLTDQRIRYLVLDTTTGREQMFVIIIAVAAALIIGVVIFRKIRKKKNAAGSAAGSGSAGDGGFGDYGSEQF